MQREIGVSFSLLTLDRQLFNRQQQMENRELETITGQGFQLNAKLGEGENPLPVCISQIIYFAIAINDLQSMLMKSPNLVRF